MNLVINKENVSTVDYNGFTVETLIYNGVEVWKSGEKPQPTEIPTTEIWYTTTDGLTAQTTDNTGIASLETMGLISNTYENGKGIMKFSKDVTSIGTSAFNGCRELTSIEIPSGVTKIDTSSFRDCTSLTSIEIPDSVITMETGAFQNSGLRTVKLPNNITKINPYLFSGCTSLTSIEIPSGVRSIGISAFNGCGNLTNVEIPDSVTTIGANAFNSCLKLENIELSRQLRKIDNMTFCNCAVLTSVTMYDMIFEFGEMIFENTPNLHDIYFNGAKQIWENIMKPINWNEGMRSNVTIHCTDGDIILVASSGGSQSPGGDHNWGDDD